MQGKNKNKLALTIAGILALMTVLAACGGNASNGGSAMPTPTSDSQTAGQATPESTEEPAATETLMTDPLGNEVAVPVNPQRIIASYLEDYLVALGVKPTAQWAIGESPMAYLQGELEGIPYVPWDLPFEIVTGYDPDLIIIGDESLLSEGKYDSYAKIAPTYALGNEINGDWRKALTEIGKVLGKTAEADKALADYEAAASEAREKIAAKFETAPSAAAVWLVSGTFWVVSDNQSSGDVLYQDLGFAVPETVEQISKGEGSVWRSISMEALATMEADHIFLVDSDIESGSEALNDPVWQSIPAVKNGNVHTFGKEKSWLYTGVVANKQIIDDVLGSLEL